MNNLYLGVLYGDPFYYISQYLNLFDILQLLKIT